MKRVRKSAEPPVLSQYRQIVPHASWDDMRSDVLHGGRQAYEDCREAALADQGNICAYCECSLSLDLPHHCRVEHVHSKKDTSGTHNWALDWQNMLGVCVGGSRSDLQLPRNLSCDAYKDHMIEKGKLPTACEGWILNPLQIQASPSLFDFEKATGRLIPNTSICSSFTIAGNKHATTAQIVQHTIDMLNLNCDRLIQERRNILFSINAEKEKKRKNNIPASLALPEIAQHFLQKCWHKYFTTIRCCLGQAAEDWLQKNAYQG